MHDSAFFEINNKPTVVVASDVWVHACELQTASLGLPEIQRIFVPHPIQDATDEEIRAKADAIIDDLIKSLTKHGSSG
jgi:hypothetical protein